MRIILFLLFFLSIDLFGSVKVDNSNYRESLIHLPISEIKGIKDSTKILEHTSIALIVDIKIDDTLHYRDFSNRTLKEVNGFNAKVIFLENLKIKDFKETLETLKKMGIDEIIIEVVLINQTERTIFGVIS